MGCDKWGLEEQRRVTNGTKWGATDGVRQMGCDNLGKDWVAADGANWGAARLALFLK